MDKQARISVIKAMMAGIHGEPCGGIGYDCKNPRHYEWNALARELQELEQIPEAQITDKVDQTIAERGKIYGDPYQSHRNIGLAWTALIQQHYGIALDHPLTAALVAQMMVAFKVQRSARVFHADNYVDATAYLRFSESFQQKDVKQ